MHELAICQSLVGQASAIARQREAQVVRLLVAIGPLSGVEPALLRRAFPLAAAGSPLEGAELDIRLSSVEVNCDKCDRVSKVTANKLVCPLCGNWRTSLASGDEMLLERVELEALARGDEEIQDATSA